MASAVICTSVATTNWNASNNPTINLPASIAAGDLLIISICGDSNTCNFTAPAGWTSLPAGTIHAGANISGNLFWKIASGSEGTTVNVAIDQTRDGTAVSHRITAGFNASNPFNFCDNKTGTGTSISFAGSTSTQPTNRWAFGGYNVKGTANTPTGFTNRGDISGIASTDTQTITSQENTDQGAAGAFGGMSPLGNGVFTSYVVFQVGIEFAAAGTNVNVPAAFTETESTNTPTFAATADVTTPQRIEVESFNTPTLSAPAAVTTPQRIEVESFNTPTISTVAGVTPNPLVEVESFSAASLSSTAGVTPNGVLELESFNVPTVGVITNVNVPASVLEVENTNVPTLTANVSGVPVVETEQFNTPTFTSTGSVTPNPLVEIEQFGTAIVSAAGNVTAPQRIEVESFNTPTFSSTAAVTPNPVVEIETALSPVVTTPSSVTPLPFQETELFFTPTSTAPGNVTPNPVVEQELFPSSSVNDGSAPAGTGGSKGTVWINEPWFDWPTPQEALV